MIIHQLLEGTKRFNQLQRELTGITHRTLAKQLREMERQGLIARHDYREIPPRVDYSLTPLGLTLRDILQAMHVWAEKYGERISVRDMRDEADGGAAGIAAPSKATARTARNLFGR
jgi:DNA-binding HxlR family transcriptional regulator